MQAVIDRFEQYAPASVMARMALEQALPAMWGDDVFEANRQRPYPSALMLSTIVGLMTLVTLGLPPSVYAAARTDTGCVREQTICVQALDEAQTPRTSVAVHQDQTGQPHSSGDATIRLWSNLPITVDASAIAVLYRRRWRIEGMFQRLESVLHSEIHTTRACSSPCLTSVGPVYERRTQRPWLKHDYVWGAESCPNKLPPANAGLSLSNPRATLMATLPEPMSRPLVC